MTIVTTHYRYKRPPRKRKAVALEGPAVVKVEKRDRRGNTETAAQVVGTKSAHSSEGEGHENLSTPIDADRKSAVVTIRGSMPSATTSRS